MGLLSNRVGLPSNGVDLLSRERVLENTPIPLFEQPLKFIAHGRIFKRLCTIDGKIQTWLPDANFSNIQIWKGSNMRSIPAFLGSPDTVQE